MSKSLSLWRYAGFVGLLGLLASQSACQSPHSQALQQDAGSVDLNLVDGAFVDLAGDGGLAAPQFSAIAADPFTIAAGDSSTLSWTVSNATSYTISGGTPAVNVTQAATTLVVMPTSTSTYAVQATGPGGSDTATVTVTVIGTVSSPSPSASPSSSPSASPSPSATPLPKITSYLATPSAVNSGGTSKLTWTATNATSYTINGVAATSPHTTAALTVATAFVLKAIGPGGTASASTTVTVNAAATYSGLHTSGAQILDGNNKVVQLHGVNRAGEELQCVSNFATYTNYPTPDVFLIIRTAAEKNDSDDTANQNTIAAMKAWNINTVRIPLNESCWLATNNTSSLANGTTYQNGIKRLVQLIEAQGMYVILDLHWVTPGTGNPNYGQLDLADADHSPTFWTQVATMFKNDGSVIFELFNEPAVKHNGEDDDTAWTCWRDGGTACPWETYTIAGMQSLINAVRATGAKNLVLAGGEAQAADLGSWLTYKPTDSANNLAAAFHGYYHGDACTDGDCFAGVAAVVAGKYPVVTTEFGNNDSDCSTDDTWDTTVMTWMDQHALGYLAWTFNTWGGCPNWELVSDEEKGTPSGTGPTIKAHYLTRP